MDRPQKEKQQTNGVERIDRLLTNYSTYGSRLYQWKSSATATSRLSDETIVKPTVLLTDPSRSCPYDLGWYDNWVRHQIKSQPPDIFSTLLNAEATCNDDPMTPFIAIWREVWSQASVRNSSIDTILTHLQSEDLIKMSEHDAETLSCARNLVFAIIGWQTMLYRPDIGSCPRFQLSVVDETEGHRGHAYMNLRQDESASRKVLHEFLMGYGVLLPCHNFGLLASEEDKKALAATRMLSPDLLNMRLLVSVGGIHIKWTDSLACHLELDTLSNTLFVFRFPTFCAISLQGNGDQERDHIKTTLHSCAAPPNAASQWATCEEVDDLLRETLLSFRLLFAQDKSSRKLFRSQNPFEGLPENCRDNALSELCGRKKSNFPTWLQDLDSYILSRDFPILRSRLAVLAQHLSNKRPRTWRELWNDKRDSASWFTFWAVLVIGGMGIFLAFVQVILQIIQLSLQAKG